MSTLNTMILTLCALISALTPVMLAFMNRSQKERAESADRTRGQLEVKLTNIQQSVDNDKTRMLTKIEAMHGEILKLTSANVRLEEKNDR